MVGNLLLDTDLPSDVNTEKNILGAITLNPELLDQALAILKVADFYLDSHRRIFDAMVSLRQGGNPLEAATLSVLLNERKELEQVGGFTYLASLIDGVPRTDNIEYYCRIIRYKAQERQAIALLNHGIAELVDGEDDLYAILQSLQSRLEKISASGTKDRAITGVYKTLDAFFEAQFEEPEPIIFGVHRGEVAGLFAITNYGKSTLLYNISLSIAAGKTLWPLATFVPKPRRVLYIDSESTALRSRSDLKTMIRGISNSKSSRENFSIVVDASIDGSPLNLSKAEHLKWIIAQAKAHKADLVVIDTAASTFELQDENSNAEITRKVMNPLKQLAREANCAVIFTHHIGKSNETHSGEAAYKGRGASAFGALSRTIFTIEKDAKKGPGYIVLSCAKIKGQSFEPVLLKLNTDTRWFELCDDKPGHKPEPPTAQEIANFVATRGEALTEDIQGHFKGRTSVRTIADRISEAATLGLIEKANQKAPWRLCKSKDGHFPNIPEAAAESTDVGFVQDAIPISNCANAQTKEMSSSKTEFSYCPKCSAKGPLHSYCDLCGEFLRAIE